MSEHEEASDDHGPKHQLEKGLLGKPKHGMQRVSDLSAKYDESVDDAEPDHVSATIEDEEYST
jgi:hypothetical protein